jgi:hypothetical protein
MKKTIDEAREKSEAKQGLNHRDEWDSPAVKKKHAIAVFLPVLLEATGCCFLHSLLV